MRRATLLLIAALSAASLFVWLAAARDPSPINFVTKGAPPFLFFHGTEDALIPIAAMKQVLEFLGERFGK